MTASPQGWRLAVTGSRSWADPNVVPPDQAAVEAHLLFTQLDGFLAFTMMQYDTGNANASLIIVHGAASKGADHQVVAWLGAPLPSVGLSSGILAVEPHPAEWDKYGRSAGYRRNAEMAATLTPGADVCLAFWDGKSRGTKHMIDLCQKRGVLTYIIGRANQPESVDSIREALTQLEKELS